MSPGWLIPPVIHGKTLIQQYQRTTRLCVPVSQRPLSQEIKGSSDTDSHREGCLPGQLCSWWLGRDQETSRSWKRVSQRAQLPARAHQPAAVQSQVLSLAPRQSPGLLHLGLHCKDMALSKVTPRGQHLKKALDTSAVLIHWHQGWVSLLVPQNGLSQQAYGVS